MAAIQNLQPPTTVIGCRSFVEMVNFLSMFCPELQKLLKPTYDLIRKGKPFVWGKEQQDSFEEIRCRLVKPPVFHMLHTTGRFHFYSDTSKFAKGSVLCQIQNGKSKLIAYAYASKRLPEAAKIFYYWIRAMQISLKHSQFLSLVKKSWLWCYSGPSITYSHH